MTLHQPFGPQPFQPPYAQFPPPPVMHRSYDMSDCTFEIMINKKLLVAGLVAITLILALAALVLGPGLAKAAPGPAPTTWVANGQFFQCLASHGVVVYDTDKVVDIARRIQTDERNGLPREVILNNLETIWGETPYIANVDVDCAWATINL
jgi:hypothetical protein